MTSVAFAQQAGVSLTVHCKGTRKDGKVTADASWFAIITAHSTDSPSQVRYLYLHVLDFPSAGLGLGLMLRSIRTVYLGSIQLFTPCHDLILFGRLPFCF